MRKVYLVFISCFSFTCSAADGPLGRLGDAISSGTADWAKKKREDDAYEQARAERAAEREFLRAQEERLRAGRLEVERIRNEARERAESVAKKEAEMPQEGKKEANEASARYASYLEFTRNAEKRIRLEGYVLFAKLITTATPDALARAMREQGVEKAITSFPLLWNLSSEVIEQIVSDAEELRRLTTIDPGSGLPVRQFEGSSDQHNRLIQFIKLQGELYKQQEEDRLLRDGKRFLSRDEYYTLEESKRSAHWTFTIDEVIMMLASTAKKQIDARIAALP